MTLHFNLSCRETGGKQIILLLDRVQGHAARGGQGQENPREIPMTRAADGSWHARMRYPGSGGGRLSYSYWLQWEPHIGVHEEKRNRHVGWKPGDQLDMRLVDEWNDPAEPLNIWWKKPFSNGAAVYNPVREASFTHEFRIRAPQLKPGESVGLLGDIDAFGGWQTHRALPMQREGREWVLRVSLDPRLSRMEYKYVVTDVRNGSFLGYEEGENRVLEQRGRERVIVTGNFMRVRRELWRGAGVSVPVFSLRSRAGVGIGEFADIRLLADWAAAAGLTMLQLLPVNDTAVTGSWKDSYPYAAISAFALNPVYIRLRDVGRLPAAHPLEKKYGREAHRLNRLTDVDYEAVLRFKWEYLEALYALQQDDFLKDPGFLSFFDAHRSWLEPYAVFCFLRDGCGTADYTRFGDLSRFDRAKVRAFASASSPHYRRLAIHYFVQYHLHLQLLGAAAYARKKGVALKGDIPIGISRHSVDAWTNPDRFFLQMQAGAPPDGFAVKGQNWGFPTYHWERMQRGGFLWWKQRLGHLSLYFDAMRFDHILGFFRIWQIPAHAVQGIMGHFYPALPLSAEEAGGGVLPFDEERYCEPYVTGQVLAELFGAEAAAVKDIFLKPAARGRYRLKARFATQRKIEAFFGEKERQGRPLPPAWKDGLFELVSNVLFFRAGDAELFHPRFSLMDTSSFRALPAAEQERLRRLHDDYFYRRQDGLWQQEALRKLPALKQATDMLLCAEDLGMIPSTVPETLRSLGMLALEVQRMPKESGREFAWLDQAPYLSVVTPGTHDMSTLRGWWQEDAGRTQRFYTGVLGHAGGAPAVCDPALIRQIIALHLDSSAMLAVVQLQDFLSLSPALARDNPHEERINIPADADHYWRYRMHLTLERLLEEKAFNAGIRDMVSRAGRDTGRVL